MKVKNAFKWERTCSCIPGAIDVPAGAPVEHLLNTYFVVPSFFTDAVVRHDAEHYGCRVAPDNVEV